MAQHHPFRFPREHRLRRPEEFGAVVKRGKRIVTGLFILYFLPSNGKFSRLGVVVSKKVGRAVVRNRAKRVLREVFRLNRVHLLRPVDMVVIVKSGDTYPAYGTYEKDLLHGISTYFRWVGRAG